MELNRGVSDQSCGSGTSLNNVKSLSVKDVELSSCAKAMDVESNDAVSTAGVNEVNTEAVSSKLSTTYSLNIRCISETEELERPIMSVP